MRFNTVSIIQLLCVSALAHPLSATSSSEPLPLLIWHGLGDHFDADGLQSTGELAQSVHPGTRVHYIRLDESGDEDRKASFLGNVSAQLDAVCASLHNESSLWRAAPTTAAGGTASKTVLRADALGFSQGGQFLRGLAERCDGLALRSLVTFGSQHNGISDFSACGTWDLLCRGALGLIRGNAWGEWVQGNVVPAQYYRETDAATGLGSAEYLEASHFLADVNNERAVKNGTYVERIAALEAFVMYIFEDDTTVIPKESGWFAEVNATSGEVTPLRERRLYAEDWLGLRRLDDKGGLVFRSHPGGHMQLEEKVMREAFRDFFGPEREKAAEGSVMLGHAPGGLTQIIVNAWHRSLRY